MSKLTGKCNICLDCSIVEICHKKGITAADPINMIKGYSLQVVSYNIVKPVACYLGRT